VLPVVDSRIAYIIAIVVGSLTVALIINALRKWSKGSRERGTA